MNNAQISPRSLWKRSGRRLTLISLPKIKIERRCKNEEKLKKEVEKKQKFDELSLQLPRIQAKLSSTTNYFRTFQPQWNTTSGTHLDDGLSDFACFSVVYGEHESETKELYRLKSQQILPNDKTITCDNIDKAYSSMRQLYAKQAFHLTELLSLSSPSSNYLSLSNHNDEDKHDNQSKRAMIRWRIEQEMNYIARVNRIIIAFAY
ncbi:unnamed protein product [Anisakis simplex]|uniref:Uncharacterized protein n=1 Tax=Anisakis simplex TaxID=6269 RepID=A0A0M3JW34_ANISI|nr:unnamed protein product [Anisakis simplex]